MNDKLRTVGVDHIAFYAPRQYLPMELLAAARNVSVEKYTIGIGIKEAAVASPAEDAVVLAANAGSRVLKEAGISPDEIGLLIVGTESAEDKSKPTATHVHGLLDISSTCRVYDIIHACAGATYGVLSAMDWVVNQDKRYALVIASDIARYGKNSLGEPTQGAGAVAILVSCSPRLMTLREISSYSKNVYDFWKPMDKDYPIVEGVLSTMCYGKAAMECFKCVSLSRESAYLYHVPYPKLVQQIHSRVAGLIGPDIKPGEHFEQYVADSCKFAAQIGNIYTGSLWLALMSFLGTCNSQFDGAYLFSYGSGCGAVLMGAQFLPSWAEQAAHFKFDEYLKSRISIGVEEYERFVSAYENPDSFSDKDLARLTVGGPFRYLATKNDKRMYGTDNDQI